jgi:hypothetical protein
MSKETYQTLDAAINSHVVQESFDGDMVRDWVLVASVVAIDQEDSTTEIVVHRSSNTALYAVTGLLEWGKSAFGEVDL